MTRGRPSAGQSRLRNPLTKPGRVVDHTLPGTGARVSRPTWCYRRITIPSWGGQHARWGPTDALPDQPKKLRVSNPDRFPMCMPATVAPPPEGESAPAAVLGSCRRVVDGGRPPPVAVCTVRHTSPKQSSRLMASQARGNPHPTNVDRAQPVLLVCRWERSCRCRGVWSQGR